MASHDDELWDQVSGLLKSRRCWSLERQTTPGAPPIWCFGSGGECELSVSIDSGNISVYLVDKDQEITLRETGALIEWLDSNEVFFFRRTSMPGGDFDEMLARKIEEWRRQGI